MDYLSFLLAPASWPTSGVWEAIVKVFSGVGNFGLAIILLTLCLKIVLLPVDFWQRSIGRKMSLQQAAMQPELEKIKQKYGNSQEGQIKTQELYKKYGVSPTASCGGMLVYMAVTFIVFITLFSSLGNISRVKINYEYYELQTVYTQTYTENLSETNFDTTTFATAEDYAIYVSQQAVATKYDEIREGFLSIKNIWRPDNWSSVFPTADEFISTTSTKFYIIEDGDFKNYVALSTNAGVPYVDVNGNVYAIPSENAEENTSTKSLTIDNETKEYTVVYGDSSLVTEEKTISAITTELASNQFKEDFTTVTAGINAKYENRWNGYMVLIILAGVVTFLSQFLSTIGVKSKDKKGNDIKGAKTKITSGLILAAIMVLFTFNYTSMFALYIVTNSILSILFNILINLTMNKMEIKKDKKKTKNIVADYVRVDK